MKFICEIIIFATLALLIKVPVFAIDISEFGDFSSRSLIMATPKGALTQEQKDLLLSKKISPSVTCLIDQIKKHNNDNVRILLESKVDPNQNYLTEYPISIAAKENNFEALKLLYEHGAKLDKGFDSELFFALKNKNKQMAQYLLDRNAKVNYCDVVSEKTTLYYSLKNNMFDISKQLIEKGANPDKYSITIIKNKKLFYLIPNNN